MPAPTFTINMPTSGESLGSTYQKVQDNFMNYWNNFQVNHVNPNDANGGKHTKVQMIEQGADPATAINEMAMYTKDVAGNTRTFLRQENNGAVMQLSGITPVAAANGYTFLPGGLMIQWGQITTSSKTAVITFTPAFDTVFQAVVAQSQADRMIAVQNLNNNNFTVQIEKNSGTNNVIRFIAIGTKA